MSNYKVTMVNNSLSDRLSHNVEFIAKDGNVTDKQAQVQLASPIIHQMIVANPDSISFKFEFKNYSLDAIKALLQMIYTGQLTVTDEALKKEVFEFAKDLQIKIQICEQLPREKNLKLLNVKVDDFEASDSNISYDDAQKNCKNRKNYQ